EADILLRADTLREFGNASMLELFFGKASQVKQSGIGDAAAGWAYSPAYQLLLKLDGQPVSTVKNGVLLELGYALKPDQQPGKVVAYTLLDDGTPQIVRYGRYDPSFDKLTFQLQTLQPFGAAYHELSFSDIGTVPWAKESIEELAAKGMLRGPGNGRFAPEAEITRAEFAMLLMNIFDLADAIPGGQLALAGREAAGERGSGKQTAEKLGHRKLTDMDNSAWYYQAVTAAQLLGIAEGRTDGSFGVNDPISRQELAVMVYRLIPVAGLNGMYMQKAPEEVFSDESSIAGYARESVISLQRAGLLQGTAQGMFKPRSGTTRAEAAVLLHRLYKLDSTRTAGERQPTISIY
ncbi:S-layer homology domain-containing protein, partial [Paenibacillus riograndensis]